MQNQSVATSKGNSNSIPWLGTFHSISVKFLKGTLRLLDTKVTLQF